MAESLLLLLDLGDIITKGMAVAGGRCRRFIFPSVVAHRLIAGGPEDADLLLDHDRALLRLPDFDPRRFPRTRSYPRQRAYLPDLAGVARARFAGKLAVALGADRRLFGRYPIEQNVDALVHKALLLTAEEHRRAEIVFVVDMGTKTHVIWRYAQAMPREIEIVKRKARNPRSQRIRLEVHGRVVDAADCALAALPPELAVERVERVLLVDVGYLKTKLAIMSADGCELQEQLDGLGISDCVRRILRDEQEHGLIEDEYAVARALEQPRAVDGSIEVAGREFTVRRTLESAKRALAEELGRSIQRAIVGVFEQRGHACRVAAIMGGGAAVVGQVLAARLRSPDVGIQTAWVCPDTKFFLVEGARVIAQRATQGHSKTSA